MGKITGRGEPCPSCCCTSSCLPSGLLKTERHGECGFNRFHGWPLVPVSKQKTEVVARDMISNRLSGILWGLISPTKNEIAAGLFHHFKVYLFLQDIPGTRKPTIYKWLLGVPGTCFVWIDGLGAFGILSFLNQLWSLEKREKNC